MFVDLRRRVSRGALAPAEVQLARVVELARGAGAVNADGGAVLAVRGLVDRLAHQVDLAERRKTHIAQLDAVLGRDREVRRRLRDAARRLRVAALFVDEESGYGRGMLRAVEEIERALKDDVA